MKTCEKCGFINDDNDKFCTSCGSILTEAAAPIVETVDEPVEEVAQEPVYEPEIAAQEPAYEPEVAAEEPEIVVEEPEPVPTYEPIPAPAPAPIPAPIPAPAPAQAAPVQANAAPTPKKGEHTIKGRAFGIIGFILNLDALIASILPGSNFAALIYSIIGLIFCHISKNNTNFRLTKVAKVFGILALIFSIVTIVIYGVLLFLFIEMVANDPQVQDFFGRLFY